MRIFNSTFTYFVLCLIFLVSCNKSGNNTIEGNIGFPSDYVPEVRVFLKNVETGQAVEQIVSGSFEGESTYLFTNIPDGKYIIYAIPTTDDGDKTIGGYTHAVPCGLGTDCTNHEYIHLEVKNDIHLKDINIYDWFTGTKAEKRLKEHSV